MTTDNNALLLSIMIVALIFTRSWLGAYQTALSRCETVESCNLNFMVVDLLLAILKGIAGLGLILFFMWFVEVVIIGVLAAPADGPSFSIDLLQMSHGFRVLISWISDWHMIAAIACALMYIATIGPTVTLLTKWYAEKKRMGPNESRAMMKRGITTVYIFSLFCILMFIGYQLWINYAIQDIVSVPVTRKCQ